jgi:hypothetical protein
MKLSQNSRTTVHSQGSRTFFNTQFPEVRWGYFTTVSQSVSQHVLLSNTLVGPAKILLPVGMLLSEICGLVSVGRPFWQCNHSITRTEPVTILYCLIWDSRNLEVQVPVFISPRNMVAQLYTRALGLVQGELTVYCPWYDTDSRENDAFNNSSIYERVFVATITFLPSRCLATISNTRVDIQLLGGIYEIADKIFYDIQVYFEIRSDSQTQPP